MAKKEKKKMRSMTAITWLLFGALMLSWLVPAAAMTVIVASQHKSSLHSFYSSLYIHDRFGYDLQEAFSTQNPSRIDSVFLEEIRSINITTTGWTMWSLDWLPLIPDNGLQYQEAIAVYDPDGNLLYESGDYLYFTGYAQRDWSDPENLKYANGQFMYVKFTPEDREAFSDLYTAYESNYGWLPFVEALRITGTMEGSCIKPQKIECLYSYSIENSLHLGNERHFVYDEQGNHIGTDYYQTLSLQDEKGANKWVSLGEKEPTGEDLVTVYSIDTQLQMTVHEPSPVTYQGVKYDSLLDLLKSFDPLAFSATYDREVDTLFQQVQFDAYYPRDLSNYNGDIETYPEESFIMLYAMEGSPLLNAFYHLKYIYLISAMIALMLWLILCRQIRRRLVKHIQAVNSGIDDNWDPHIDGGGEPWREAAALRERYFAEGDHRRKAQNEIARLSTALKYARQAEESRRQMTSSIAHELKTPLAIIHSYSEGLKEHIADDKRDQYLDTILSETERMDTMVLQMLDLSRLEAGKVKLQRDEFSLSRLTKATFDAFAPMAEEKGLQVTLELEGDCPVVADEARIEQVIRNFASNAVRYTPEGGTILVKVRYRIRGVRFSVENSGTHFTEEELSKVWDTFYRTDKARDRKGTGLGLAIAKNIISLHGGDCSVKNTDTGVEFSFTL